MTKVMPADGMEVRGVRGVGNRVRIQETTGICPRTETVGRRRRWNSGTVYVHSWVLFLPFSATILKPDFHLEQLEFRRNFSKAQVH